MKRSKVTLSTAAVIAALLPAASAASSPPHAPASSSVFTVLATNPVGVSSTVTVTMAKKLTPQGEQAVKLALSSATGSATTNVSPAITPPPGTTYASLYCNRPYTFNDANGSFSYQHACGGGTAPWGFYLSAGWRSIIYTSVKEDGMEESINGGTYHRLSPHIVPSSYTIHGTFNPIRAGYYLDYYDHYSFGIIIDGNPGEASMYVSGNVHQVN